MKRILAAALVASMLAGCATTQGYGAGYQPIIDLRPGQTVEAQAFDLRECQLHATKIIDAQTAAIGGAIAGALLGAALGAAAGGNSRFNGQMAGVGAITGGTSFAAQAEGGQRGIIMRCMSGRGYMVLA